MRTVYVVTHPEATHHLDHLVGGWFDSDLSPHGHLQAAAIARRLRELIPRDATTEIYSSDLQRTLQTADAIAAELGVPVRPLADLREKSYGEAEGRPQQWLDERFVFPPATGPRIDHHEGISGAETRREFGTRIYRALETILASDASHQVVVTHGFALTMFVAAWVKMPLESADYIGVNSTSGGITHLQQGPPFHNRTILAINETTHLP